MMGAINRLLLAAVLIPLYAEFALAACPQNYVDIEGRCFIFFNRESVNFAIARTMCQNNQGDLAVLDDCNVFGSVVQHIHNYGLGVPEGYWIGAHDQFAEGTWEWITGVGMEMGAPFWGRDGDDPNEPEGGTTENCLQMQETGRYYFSDVACSDLLPPICQRPHVLGQCPSPYVEVGSSCFQFLSTLEDTFDDARALCQAAGGDLAIIDECNLMKDVIRYINDNGLSSGGNYWIGGSDSAVEGAWKWINGSSVAMGVPFWGRSYSGQSQPNNGGGIENCAGLWSEDRYYFNDFDCSSALSPLCQAPAI